MHAFKKKKSMCIFLVNRPWDDSEHYTMVSEHGSNSRTLGSLLFKLFFIYFLCSDWKLIHELFTLKTHEAWMVGEEEEGEVEGLGGVVHHLFCNLHLHVIH